MAFHNPFIKDGLIKFPDNGSLVKHVERWARVRGDKLAYRFIDFSTERDGVERAALAVSNCVVAVHAGVAEAARQRGRHRGQRGAGHVLRPGVHVVREQRITQTPRHALRPADDADGAVAAPRP